MMKERNCDKPLLGKQWHKNEGYVHVLLLRSSANVAKGQKIAFSYDALSICHVENEER